MKSFLLLILILDAFSEPGSGSSSSSNDHDYSSYAYVSKDEDLKDNTLSSTTADQSVVYITKSGKTIQNSNINKESGDSSDTEKSEFFGINASNFSSGRWINNDRGNYYYKGQRSKCFMCDK